MWVAVLCWIDRVRSSKECVYCASDRCVHLDDPSICLVLCGFVYAGLA